VILEDRIQVGATRPGLRRGHDFTAHIELLPHPLDPDAGMRDAGAERRRDVATAHLPRALQQPQREQHPVVRVQPSTDPGHLAALGGQLQLQHGRAFGIRRRVGHADRLVQHGDSAIPRRSAMQVSAYLVYGDGRQPGPEALRPAQRRQLADGPEHDVLDDVVDVRVTVQRPPHDAVDQRQAAGDEFLEGTPVAVPGRGHEARLDRATKSHLTSPSSSERSPARR
jgi:hypothetical protein